jgi:hypothetical protein
MPFAWSMLRNPEPTALAAARALAHRAVQWPARAVRANLASAPDDSHTALAWDAERAAFVTQPLKKGFCVGLRVGILELIAVKANKVESFTLAGNSEAEPGRWLDERLAHEGLKPASQARLPYDLPATLFGRPAQEAPALATLAGWFAAGAEVLEQVRKTHAKRKPGPVYCWPHHFDLAMLVQLDPARSIGIGLSPGDEHYAQPYAYVSPYPKPDTENLPALPPGGRWHTREFFGAVATATDLLALPDPRKGLVAIIEAAFDEGVRRLHVR